VTFRYAIYPERQLIVQRYAGPLRAADFLVAAEEVWADPRYVPTYDGLADLTGLRLAVSPAETRHLAEYFSNHPRLTRGRWAAIVAHPVAAALAYLYQQLARPRHRLEVFSTWEAACAYLGAELPRSVLRES
jgi:hypothetical protein